MVGEEGCSVCVLLNPGNTKISCRRRKDNLRVF